MASVDSQSRVLHVFHRSAKLQFGCSLRTNVHTTRAENLFGRAQIEVHIREIELVFSFSLEDLCILFAKESIPLLPASPIHILVGQHHYGCRQIGSTKLATKEITVERIIIDDLLTQIRGRLQIECTAIKVAPTYRLCALNTPKRFSGTLRRIRFCPIFLFLHSITLLTGGHFLLEERHSKGITDRKSHQKSQ